MLVVTRVVRLPPSSPSSPHPIGRFRALGFQWLTLFAAFRDRDAGSGRNQGRSTEESGRGGGGARGGAGARVRGGKSRPGQQLCGSLL